MEVETVIHFNILEEPKNDLLNRTEYTKKLANFLYIMNSGVYSFEGRW